MMASYLLLRDNKESGPLSFDELVRMGLKPYDLIWIEGRSAAWRYPSEIPELKNYAPTVEEQPYDRFFKKPAETQSVEEIFTEKINIDKEKKSFQEELEKKEKFAELTRKFQPQQQDNYREYQPKEEFQPKPGRQVFVSMPKSVTKRNEPKIEGQKQQASYSSYAVYSNPEPEPMLEKKYSQSLDEIKEMYVNTLVQRKNRNRRKELAKKLLRPVLYSMLLIASGVVIGYFVLNKKFSLEAGQLSVNIPAQNQTAEKKKPSVAQPENNASNQLPDKKNQVSDIQQPIQKPLKTQQAIAKTDPIIPNSTSSDALNQSTSVDKKDVEIDPQTGERSKVVRDSNNATSSTNSPKDDKPSGSSDDSKDVKKLVSINANDYLRGVFGGIRNLELTVHNRSKYALDAVTVQVDYLKNTNQTIKSETITFKNVNANGVATVRVPDSQRGMKVSYHITNIEGRDF